MNDLQKLLYLFKSKNDHFLLVDFKFYKKWKLVINLIVSLNKDYISCEIFRKRYKFRKNVVVVGLKWNGKNVKRRTSGYAKENIEGIKNPKCIYCEKKLNNNNATSDHIIPISDGGNNCQVNLVVVCIECNSERGSMKFIDYLKLKNEKYGSVKEIFI